MTKQKFISSIPVYTRAMEMLLEMLLKFEYCFKYGFAFGKLNYQVLIQAVFLYAGYDCPSECLFLKDNLFRDDRVVFRRENEAQT